MNSQLLQLAGAPVGDPARSEKCAHLPLKRNGEWQKMDIVAALLAAFTSALNAEEALLDVALHAPANDIRAVIEGIRGRAREAIEAASVAPGHAFERVILLRHAVDLEGADSPLVAKAAQALAHAIEPPACVAAG